jgi:hypothetical protein
MPGFREFLRSRNGQIAGMVLLVIGIALGAYSVWSNVGPSTAAAISNDRIFVDAKTGQAFHHTLSLDDRYPIKAPSGGNTGYPAELCYWNKDGTPKKPGEEPTAVLMNSWLNKSGPTFCPECGRLVVMHNPAPEPGMRPPPTQEEMHNR